MMRRSRQVVRPGVRSMLRRTQRNRTNFNRIGAGEGDLEFTIRYMGVSEG